MSMLYTGMLFLFDIYSPVCSDNPLTCLLYFHPRGHLKQAQHICDEVGVLASLVTGVDLDLKAEASLRHARTLLAAKQYSQVKCPFLCPQTVLLCIYYIHETLSGSKSGPQVLWDFWG